MVIMKLILLVGAAIALALPCPALERNDGKCVNGSPTNTGGYTIQYQQVSPARANSNDHFILDPKWQEAHATLGSSMHFSYSGSAIPYGEFKCQYGCNGLQGCASYVGYENRDADGKDGGFDCFFFDALIDQYVIVSTQSNKQSMTHAYNKLCNSSGQGEYYGSL
ncbi:hypothetical protein CDD82_4761 [Ophiocordyceps australis]|uniref:Apple domain-containing protein n=1 Tax=Ophiocordyceps australis TaxID=1399860 RepID=A0A2C5Y9S8_9HYPO|nr:hypothetical protein CDD82_4761 [Ophiocordyceps australis]